MSLKPPEFLDSRHIKVGRLSALHTGHLYPPGDTPSTHICCRLSQFQGHNVARTIKPMKTTTLETRYCCFSYMHFVLICTVVVLYCFVVCVCACGCMSGFCNVCVCVGVFGNMHTVL